MIDHPVQRAAKFVLACVTDPVTGGLSSARIAGLGCVALADVIGLKHPEAAATVAAFISGGAVAFLTRTKSDAP